MVSCILLAAGSSTRFGSPKALARVKDTTVIGYLQNTLVNSKIDQVIVVLGDHSHDVELHILNHKKVRLVYNKDYNLGQTSSFKAGLKAISPKAAGIFLCPVDVPFVSYQTIDLLIHHLGSHAPSILIPAYQGKRGHPPWFHIKHKNAFLGLENTSGLNVYEHQHESEITVLPVDDCGVISSFNTAEEFENIKASF